MKKWNFCKIKPIWNRKIRIIFKLKVKPKMNCLKKKIIGKNNLKLLKKMYLYFLKILNNLKFYQKKKIK